MSMKQAAIVAPSTGVDGDRGRQGVGIDGSRQRPIAIARGACRTDHRDRRGWRAAPRSDPGRVSARASDRSRRARAVPGSRCRLSPDYIWPGRCAAAGTGGGLPSHRCWPSSGGGRVRRSPRARSRARQRRRPLRRRRDWEELTFGLLGRTCLVVTQASVRPAKIESGFRPGSSRRRISYSVAGWDG
jgi:hypothetical protein